MFDLDANVVLMLSAISFHLLFFYIIYALGREFQNLGTGTEKCHSLRELGFISDLCSFLCDFTL